MTEEYDNTGMNTQAKPSLEDLFEQVRAKDAEQLRKRREEVKKSQAQNPSFQIIRYVMYFWVGRMAIALVGSLLPMMMAFWMPNSSSRPSSSLKAELEVLPYHLLVQQDFKVLHDPILQKTPYLINQSPIINNSTLKLFLSNLFKKYKLPIKISENKEYIYYSDDRLWSKELKSHHSHGMKYQYIHLDEYFNESKYRFPSFSFLDFLKPPQQHQSKDPPNPSYTLETTSTGDVHLEIDQKEPQMKKDDGNYGDVTHYMYIGYPHMASYLDSFAPSLKRLSSKLSLREPQCNLWMASKSVIAKMHYDYQDNFLLQLTGTKQVLVMSPEAFHLVLPYPSLHPLWRQTSQSTDFLAESVSSASQAHPFIVWNITLQAGDILHIPSGFYHQVIAGEDSMGINAWFPSSFSEFQFKLSKLPLPFLLDDSIAMKVAKVGIIMKELCLFLHEDMGCLVSYMNQRYQPILQQLLSGDKQCSDDISEEWIYFCQPMEYLKVAGKTCCLLVCIFIFTLLFFLSF